MKKSFRHILTILGATWLATGITANAQTLTQDWSYKTELPASADARWGVGKDGKVWTNNPATSTLIYWDAEGKHEQAAGVGGGGWALTVDDAGNVLVSNGKWGTASTDMRILPAGGDAVQAITLTMPRGVNAASIQYIARAKGDIMSEEGGIVYMFPSGAGGAAKIVIKNGAQVAEESAYITSGDAALSDGQSLSVPLDMEDMTNDEVAFRVRANQDFYVYNGEEYAPLKRLNVNTTPGGDAFYWGGKLYTIEPVGPTAYCDGFEVVDRSDPENPKVIASHVEEATAQPAYKPAANCLTAEIVDEYTLNIYQYVPDIIVAKYTLTLPKPAPKLEARNAYAYDITVTENGENYDVAYRLNAPAETVEVQVANVANDEVLLTYAGTTRANYTDDSKTDIDNLNTVTIPAADLPEGIEMSFRVAVTSQNVETPTAFSKEYSFWSPYGIAVDNNTDSPNFGRVLVTESQPSLPATGYHTSVDDGGIGIGIYAFDPMMNPIKNSQGTYGFTGGMTMGTGSYPEESGGSGTIYDVKRLQYSEDGRLFVSRVVLNESSLWELDPNNLEAGATPVFQGTNGTDGVMTDASGNFVAGPATAMAVTGSGEDLKVAIVSVAGGYVVSPTVHRVDVYNLGTAKTWDSAPSQALESVSGKYWINTPMVNMTFDPEGNGLFIGQHRATPTVDEPAQVYVDLASGEVKYTDITTSYINAMAWNSDKSLLAMSCGAGGTIGVYEVTFTDGVPSFTQKYTFVSGCGGNTNAIAFDAADNLYVASNSGELLRSFAMPRESGECVVAAPSQYNVLIGELLPVYPETMYVMGDVVADADLEMTAEGEGVYTIEDVEISDAGEGYGFIKFAESTDSEETYGPAVDGTELVAGTAGDIAANGNSYKVAVAVYDIEIDLAAGTITLTWKGDAVESMEVSTAKVIGGTGEIRVVGDAKSVSIYNMAGQAIVLNSGEMTFNVASGYYIVVVDGKTTKVMVR